MTACWTHRTIAPLLALALAGCAASAPPQTQSPPAAAACPAGLERWIRTELYFGLNWPQGVISESQWRDFVNREVAPRLPEGFTVIGAEGAWRSAQTGQTIREPSRVLQRLRKPDAAQEPVFAAIVDAYKTRFRQDAVLRVDTEVCAAL